MLNKHSASARALHSAAPSPLRRMVEPIRKMASPHLRWDLDLTQEELYYLLDLADVVKRQPMRYAHVMAGYYLSLLFEKPSLRTRLTFELAIKQLGGDCVATTGPIGDREPLKDVARNLVRWTHGIVARTYSQNTIEELAKWAAVPVINALSDLYHPCQALADVLTLREHFGRLDGLRLSFLGDGNNVAHSLMLTATRLGVSVTVATPKGYEPNEEIVERARGLAAANDCHIHLTNDPEEASRGAHAIYTDVWTSMGQEEEAEIRQRVFQPFQVTLKLLSLAEENAIFMHCLPAKRGQEVADEVAESKQSVVFDQAENRLHAQKALLLMLLR